MHLKPRKSLGEVDTLPHFCLWLPIATSGIAGAHTHIQYEIPALYSNIFRKWQVVLISQGKISLEEGTGLASVSRTEQLKLLQ